MAEEKRIPSKTTGQHVFLENREKMKVTGVLEVKGFDDTFLDAETELGRLLIRGEGIKIGKLSLEQHELIITGYIYTFEYEDKKKGSAKGVFARMFR